MAQGKSAWGSVFVVALSLSEVSAPRLSTHEPSTRPQPPDHPSHPPHQGCTHVQKHNTELSQHDFDSSLSIGVVFV